MKLLIRIFLLFLTGPILLSSLYSQNYSLENVSCIPGGGLDVELTVCFNINTQAANSAEDHCGFYLNFEGVNIISYPTSFSTVLNTPATIDMELINGGFILWGDTICTGTPFIVQDTAQSVQECFNFVIGLDGSPTSWTVGGQLGGTFSNTFGPFSVLAINNIVSTPDSCPANNGTAWMEVTGGSPPYAFEWTEINSGIQVSFDSLATGLTEGTYIGLVTDNGGCTASDTVEIALTNVPVVGPFTMDPATCSFSDGELSVSPVPGTGTGPFNYTWENGSGINVGNTQTVTGLNNGPHYVTITNADGICSATDGINVQNSGGEPNIGNANVVNASCGGIDGQVNVPITNGSGPYLFEWESVINPGTIISTDSIVTGLEAGTYSVTVANFDGDCPQIGFGVVNIVGGASFIASLDVSNTTCDESENGAATIQMSAGTPPYTYLWYETGNFNDTLSVTESISNFPVGSYTVFAVDQDSLCPDTLEVFILSDNNEVQIDTVIVTEVVCDSMDGTAIAMISGGIPPYQYFWELVDNPGVTISIDSSMMNLDAGDYQLVVLDSNGTCGDTMIVTVPLENSPIIDDVTITAEDCGLENGSIQLLVTGGIQPYNISWINLDFPQDTIGTSTEITFIASGDYRVSIGNANGKCNTELTFFVPEIGAPMIDSTYSIAASCDTANGAASVYVTGGEMPYQFQWENSTNPGTILSSDSLIVGLEAGLYLVTVSNANGGCEVSTSVQILPNDGQTTINGNMTIPDCNVANGAISLDVQPDSLNYLIQWSNAIGDSIGIGPNLNDIEAGYYTVLITKPDTTCPYTQGFTIDENASSEILGFETRRAACQSDGGLAIVLLQGDSAAYSYSWADVSGAIVSTDSIADNLFVGTYNITVSNPDGSCPTFGQTTIERGEDLTPVFPFVFPTKCGFDNGEAYINLFDGNEPFQYAWTSPNGIIESEESAIDSMRSGKWSLWVRDTFGCEFTQDFEVAESEGAFVDARFDQIIDIGDTAIIYVDDNLVGNLSWSPPLNINCLDCDTIIATPFETTIYIATATDASGCTYTDTVTITVNPVDKGLFMPSAFTPNNDLINDLFYINGFGIKRIVNMQIYDHLGEKIYSISDVRVIDGMPDPTLGWDGNYKGEALLPNVFIYTVEVEYLDSDIETKVGSFQLIR